MSAHFHMSILLSMSGGCRTLVYQIDSTAWVVFAIGIVTFTFSVIALIVVKIQLNRLKRERHRLDRTLNRYNSTYKDDYDFYNGF